ncbi:MAG: hypothetical protein AB7S36_07495, partial [Planctomycetota bacterium]
MNAPTPPADRDRKHHHDPLLASLDEAAADDATSRADVHGPRIARHVFEPQSLDPSETDLVTALIRDDAECRGWAGQLRTLGALSDRALPQHETRDLTTGVVSQLAAARDARPHAGIRFVCPTCEKKYEVLEKFAGRKMKCAKCSGLLTVPGARARKPASTT